MLDCTELYFSTPYRRSTSNLARLSMEKTVISVQWRIWWMSSLPQRHRICCRDAQIASLSLVEVVLSRQQREDTNTKTVNNNGKNSRAIAKVRHRKISYQVQFIIDQAHTITLEESGTLNVMPICIGLWYCIRVRCCPVLHFTYVCYDVPATQYTGIF